MDTSKKWSLNTTDLYKVLRLTLVAAVGGGAAYLLTAVVGLDLFPNQTIDELILTAVAIPLLETGRRWAMNYSK